MRTRPIIMSGESVRAILAGKKTQTRRVVKPDAEIRKMSPDLERAWVSNHWGAGIGLKVPCSTDRAGSPSETVQRLYNPWGWDADTPIGLWVRETWAPVDFMTGSELEDPIDVAYRADKKVLRHVGDSPEEVEGVDTHAWNWDCVKWKPSIFMPRWASRITSEVTEVRVERLQEIAEEDAKAEGMNPSNPGAPSWQRGPYEPDTHLHSFRVGWDQINAKRGFGWETNPWVWVIEFKREVGR